MNFADNWARVFVVITFLTFGEAQIIGGIVPNLIAFSLFLGETIILEKGIFEVQIPFTTATVMLPVPINPNFIIGEEYIKSDKMVVHF